MTLIKEKAVEMIRRMPEDNMTYVINILQNLEAMSIDRNEDKKRAKNALAEIMGYLAAHSIPNIFYVLRKEYSQEERRKFIRSLCEIFWISDLNTEKIMSAIDNEQFFDFDIYGRRICSYKSWTGKCRICGCVGNLNYNMFWVLQDLTLLRILNLGRMNCFKSSPGFIVR